jgi:hypothetical protein
MARRKKSSVNPFVLIGSLAAVGAAVGGYMMLSGKHTDTFGSISKLDPTEYLTNSTSLQGNTYQLTATITERIKNTAEGRLYSMTAKSEKGGPPEDLSVLFPATYSSETIQTGQEMTLKIEVDLHGLIRVTDIKRS